jgi:hypothetical protein
MINKVHVSFLIIDIGKKHEKGSDNRIAARVVCIEKFVFEKQPCCCKK